MDLKRYLRAQWDRVTGIALVAVGVIAIGIGWVGVSGTPYTWEQIPYIVSGGILGVALVGIGATAWLSADLRDEWRKLKDLEDALRQIGDDRVQTPIPSANGAATKNVGQRRRVGAGH